MSIRFDNESRTFTLYTKNTSYQMQVNQVGHLLHLYYGKRTGTDNLSYQYIPADCGFSPNLYEIRQNRMVSVDILPQEYSGANTGDFRLSSLELVTEKGAYGADLYYRDYKILPGKYALDGLPALKEAGSRVETLVINMYELITGATVQLLYGVFEEEDVISRAVRVINDTENTIRIEKIASACLDLPFGNWEMIHFHGRHCMERMPQRVKLNRDIQTVSSKRGSSSHHHNPFVILCSKETTEDYGLCYGAMLAYSGNHKTDVEVDQMGLTRMVMGIHDTQFTWNLEPDQSFCAPEVILTCSSEGFTRLSQTYHRILRQNMMNSKFTYARRPVLINNWEATYFDFNNEKILKIAQKAAELGVEMLVLDDGWFGSRNDDNRGLGDWFVNEKKLEGGLNPLITEINKMGMKFGLWIEPEMVNEDSDLYRAHPEWALTMPGRKPTMGRNQLVLDMSRKDVVDYLDQCFSSILENHNIEYIKWDMNRNMTDVYSHAAPAERQGEIFHRYILGVYDLLNRLTTKFPDVLFEGCAGGGGRFDAGMLQYCPQIWTSDDTDSIERLTIQYGTSFGYPVSSMGAHVSTCPNHQTGRTTPFGTRAVVAMSGTFGYELDLNLLSAEEKEEVKDQIRRFHAYYDLIQNGTYFRLTDPTENLYFTAWEFVSDNKEEALLNMVMTRTRANANPAHFWMKGLDPDAKYELRDVHFAGCSLGVHMDHIYGTPEKGKPVYTGSSLMYAGFSMPLMSGDYPSVQMHFVKVG
ncbi:MAG: alpha-galactosidase [Lachnospiraceae bacterium]